MDDEKQLVALCNDALKLLGAINIPALEELTGRIDDYLEEIDHDISKPHIAFLQKMADYLLELTEVLQSFPEPLTS